MSAFSFPTLCAAVFSWLVIAALLWITLGPWVMRGAFPAWRLDPYLSPENSSRHRRRRVTAQTLGWIGSSSHSVARRLELAGSPDTVTDFRRLQRRWALIGCLVATTLVALAWASHSNNTLLSVVMLVLFPLVGVSAADYQLSQRSRSRQVRLNQELPDVIELLALAVGAGDTMYAALRRVSIRCSDVSGQELCQVVSQVEAGDSLGACLGRLRTRNDSEILSRLVDAVVAALERGSPLAGVLRDQVADSRAAARTQLLAEGGRKEVWMMVPVVFLILPLTVVFALYPGLVALQM